MKGHIQKCKKRNNADGATLPPLSLGDGDSCKIDDTASVMSEFKNPVSDDDEPSLVG